MSFQLEEMEDQDTCSTEITLLPDGTVQVGETDGPLFVSASGTWSVDPTNPQGAFAFEMKLARQFEAGHEASSFTDIGEFSFTVERWYVGDINRVGERLAVSGSIHAMEDLEVFGASPPSDLAVGYFNMIDANDSIAY
jgi:hypothetical protein